MKRKPDHISQEEWDGVDSPPLTDKMMSRMRPHRELFLDWPDRIARRPQKAPTKTKVTIRLSPRVVEHFKSQGKGWQTRFNEALPEYVNSLRHAGQ